MGFFRDWLDKQPQKTFDDKEENKLEIGSMFKDLDHPEDDRFIKIIGFVDDGYDKVRIEFFPYRSPSYMNVGFAFFKKYKRLSKEEEVKWEKDFFADRAAYYKREEEEALKKQFQDQIDARDAAIRIKLDEEAVAIKKRIDNKKNKYLVFTIGSAEAFESLLNYATTKNYTLTNTTVQKNGVFIAVMVKK